LGTSGWIEHLGSSEEQYFLLFTSKRKKLVEAQSEAGKNERTQRMPWRCVTVDGVNCATLKKREGASKEEGYGDFRDL
jgi:hypothetical protein